MKYDDLAQKAAIITLELLQDHITEDKLDELRNRHIDVVSKLKKKPNETKVITVDSEEIH